MVTPTHILTKAEEASKIPGMVHARCNCKRGTRLNLLPTDAYDAMNEEGCLSCGGKFRLVLPLSVVA